MPDKERKPLGIKAYGHIPHLPGSRMGPTEAKIGDGQARILLEKARDKHDRIIVTEKLDGSNVAVARKDGQIIALSRAGYLASSSPYVHHHRFAEWVETNKSRLDGIIDEGERLCGEWLSLAHGTRYDLPHEPIVFFDFFSGGKRIPHCELKALCIVADLITPRILSDGPPFALDAALRSIETSGHGAIDPVEGAVWRVERKGIFDFIAKYVRPEKVDGLYMQDSKYDESKYIWNTYK